jgi:hypothetical protein
MRGEATRGRLLGLGSATRSASKFALVKTGLPCRVLLRLAQRVVANDEQLDLAAMKQRKASSGVQTIGSPRTSKLVLTSAGQPVLRLKLSMSAHPERVGYALRPVISLSDWEVWLSRAALE